MAWNRHWYHTHPTWWNDGWYWWDPDVSEYVVYAEGETIPEDAYVQESQVWGDSDPDR